MSKISLSPDASGTGIFTIASPNSNTNRTLTLPDDTGTIVTNSGNQAGSFTTLNTSGAVVFNDAGADVDFRVEGDTNANLLFVDASADAVGIGTSSPVGKLNVIGGLGLGAALTGDQAVTPPSGSLVLSGTNLATEQTYTSPGGGTTLGQIYNYASSGNSFFRYLDIIAYGSTTGAGSNIRFITGNGTTNAERMRIDSSGNVGIGTGSPTASRQLHVAGSGIIKVSTSSLTNGADFGYLAGTNDVSLYVLNRENGPMLFATNNTERVRITSGGYFKASDNGTYINATGGFHEFTQTTNTNALQISATSASLATDGFFFLRATRNTTNNTFYALDYYNDGAGAYKFRVADSGNVTNTNNSYGAISDVKLKQDIVDAASQWDDIKNLRVRKFHWKSDPDGFMQMGLVAQEAELVSPGLIDEHPDYEEVEVPVLDDEGNPVLNEDGTPQITKERNALGTTTKAIKYSVLYMKAVKALQEAMERIETLEASNTALEARIAALETGA